MNNTKEELKDSLTKLLIENLDEDSFTATLPTKENGLLCLDIPYVRIEPWVYGTGAVTLNGAWVIAVEAARFFRKTPVLAHQWHGEWCFRMPFYALNTDFEIAIAADNRHRFDWSVDLGVEPFALALSQYQEICEVRHDAAELIKFAVGV